MVPAIAAIYGLYQLPNTTGARGEGDGNGVLEDGSGSTTGTCVGAINQNQFTGEIMTFWRHLSDANLVDGQFGTKGNSAINAANCGPTGAVADITQSMPAGKIGRGIFISVMSGQGTNYYELEPITYLDMPGIIWVGSTGMTPIEAHNIDAKIDDGQPETGIVLALSLVGPWTPGPGAPATLIGSGPPWAATTSTLNRCVISSDGLGDLATDTYNLVPKTGGNDPSCGLAIRFQ